MGMSLSAAELSYFGHDIAIVSDPGVDDLVALTLADRLAGDAGKLLVSTFGNAPLEVTAANAQSFCDYMQNDWHHQRGASSPYSGDYELPWQDDFHGADATWGNRPPAGDTASATRPNGTTSTEHLISLAPLTQAQKLVASTAVSRLVIMGGAFEDYGNVSTYAECNIANDPTAASLLFEGLGNTQTSVVPLDVTRKIFWQADDIHDIPEDSQTNVWLKGMLQAWHANFQPNNPGKPFKLHDPLAVYLAFYPERAEWRTGGVGVILDGEQRGRTVFSPENAPCAVAMDIPEPRAVAEDIYRILFNT